MAKDPSTYPNMVLSEFDVLLLHYFFQNEVVYLSLPLLNLLVLSPASSQTPIIPDTSEVSVTPRRSKKKSPPGKPQLRGSWALHW